MSNTHSEIPQEIRDLGLERPVIPLPLAGMEPGVYILLLDDKAQYVGKSTCVVRRVAEHRQVAVPFGIKFDSAVYLPVEKKDLDAVEALLIRKLRPPRNKKPGPDAEA